MRVLAVRISLQWALGLERYEVHLAQDGREALECVAAARYGAVCSTSRCR
jgi:DNA-binding NtrC family response regulator